VAMRASSFDFKIIPFTALSTKILVENVCGALNKV
jgi:hypothetical protein